MTSAALIRTSVTRFSTNVFNNAAAREQAALDIQRTIVGEAPWVFLYQPDFLLATRSNVKGYTFCSASWPPGRRASLTLPAVPSNSSSSG